MEDGDTVVELAFVAVFVVISEKMIFHTLCRVVAIRQDNFVVYKIEFTHIV
jgi:hypothetical protein